MKNLIKSISIALIGFIFIILTLSLGARVYSKIPITFKYKKEINIGNSIATGIEEYKIQYGKYPDENNHSLIKKIVLKNVKQKNWIYEPFFPEYKSHGDYYTLTFVEGFEGPYITYNSILKLWKKE